MRITIGTFTLCGATETEFPADARVSGSEQIQVAALLRAARAKVFRRGNRVSRIPFAVTREHATHQAAVDWAFAHETEIPDNPTVTVLLQAAGPERLYYLHDAQVEAIRLGPVIGVATSHLYVIICGKISTEAPT